MPRHRISRSFFRYEAWPDELQCYKSPHTVCPGSPEINVKTVCKPLMIIAAHSLLRPLDTAQKRAREIAVRTDLVSGEIDKLFPVNDKYTSDPHGNKAFRDEYRGRCHYARIAARAGQTAVECATLAVKLAHYILHCALSDGVFGDHHPSPFWAVLTIWSRILYFPMKNIIRPEKDEIDAALAALKAAITACKPADDFDSQFCGRIREARYTDLLWGLGRLNDHLPAMIRDVEELEKTIAYCAPNLWWRGTAESTLFSAKTVASLAKVAERAACCLSATKSTLLDLEKVVSGATPAISSHQAPRLRLGKTSRLDIILGDCCGGFLNALSTNGGATAQADAVLAVATNAHTLEEKMNGWEII